MANDYNLNYYRLDDKLIIAYDKYPEWVKIGEDEAAEICQKQPVIFFAEQLNPASSPQSYCLTNEHLSCLGIRDLSFFYKKQAEASSLPFWLQQKITAKQVMGININSPKWKDQLSYHLPSKWRIHIVGLGDVGGTLISGLRLLGGASISEIGIYDLDRNKLIRWEGEANQIFTDASEQSFPEVKILDEAELFDCDIFVFCVTVGVPALGSSTQDVRLAQLEGNSKIISLYANKARHANFKGLFAVVSDPVDYLCKAAFDASNTNETGTIDFNGLAPEQIRGYGLGVMYARAVYHAKRNTECSHYLKEGRAFGPHGDGLVIADSISNYNERLSLLLTEKAQNSNLDIRAAGFKPYIAPAFSSGTLSLIAAITGQWHYSAVFVDGVYLGCRNRLLPAGTEIERLELPDALYKRIETTYDRLKAYDRL